MTNEHSALLASSPGKSTDTLKKLLADNGYVSVTTVPSENEARRLLISGQYDLLIVNAPLRDGNSCEMAFDAAQNSFMGIVLFISADRFEQISYSAEKYGVLTVPKPAPKQEVARALRLASATRERMRTLEKKNVKLQEKMNEIRTVNRAKWALINSLGMDEPQAHRFVEKHAMDMRISKREAAEMIIKTYEKQGW